RPARSTLFPYTTLFRSEIEARLLRRACDGLNSLVRDRAGGAARVRRAGDDEQLVPAIFAKQLAERDRFVACVAHLTNAANFHFRSEEHTSELQSQSNLV